MKKLLMLLLNIGVVGFVVLVSYDAYGMYTTKKNITAEIKETEKKIEEYNEKKKKIENDIKNFSEAEKIEKVARAKLNLKKEGEVIYRVVEQ